MRARSRCARAPVAGCVDMNSSHAGSCCFFSSRSRNDGMPTRIHGRTPHQRVAGGIRFVLDAPAVRQVAEPVGELGRERAARIAGEQRHDDGERGALQQRAHHVALEHVLDLVREHARHFIRALAGFEQAAEHDDVPAGCGERVDLGLVDDDDAEVIGRSGRGVEARDDPSSTGSITPGSSMRFSAGASEASADSPSDRSHSTGTCSAASVASAGEPPIRRVRPSRRVRRRSSRARSSR